MKLCGWMAFYVALIPTAEMLTVSGPDQATVTTKLGLEATLPCWITPAMNAENLEVRWYRGKNYDNPALLYREKKVQSGDGRTAFALREARSEGLKEGDVTMKLANVTLNDGGEYSCYVSSDKDYTSTTIQLNVTVMGTPPLLSMVRTGAGSVNVSCESRGWHPNPRLQWSDGKQTLRPGGLASSRDVQGLGAIHSWIISTSPWLSCSLSSTADEVMEGRVDLDNVAALPEDRSGWKIAFVLVLLLLIALIVAGAMLFYKKKALPSKSDNLKKGRQDEEMGKAGSKSCADLDHMKMDAVDVILDNSINNPFLKVTPNGKVVRDTDQATMTEEEWFSKPTYILGTKGFASGCKYWEVGLGDEKNEKVGVKESWWVGLASESVKQQQGDGQPTPSDGFWYLSSEREKGFKVNTAPTISFSVTPRPQTLGVYLDYEAGKLSFYNVKDETHIVTLTTKFTGKVFPLFNPGLGDLATIRILEIKPSDPKNGPGETAPLLDTVAVYSNVQVSETK